MLGMIATLGMAAKAENALCESVLLEGAAPSITNSDFDTCISGLSVSAWVEFMPSSAMKRQSEESTKAQGFDPLGLCGNGHNSLAPRHGHSLMIAMGIHHMNGGSDSDSETVSQVDVESDDELPLATGEKKEFADWGAHTSTKDTLPSMSGYSENNERSETIDSFPETAFEDGPTTQDTLPSLSGEELSSPVNLDQVQIDVMATQDKQIYDPQNGWHFERQASIYSDS